MSECILWQGYIAPNGYPRLSTFMPNGERYAHRAAYEGELEPGETVHHTCENRACVNPAHLAKLPASVHSQLHRKPKTTCKNGHAFTAENTYYSTGKNGRRRQHCRTCGRAAALRHYHRTRERSISS